jgi:multicomponent Na+:H+ antiporter subunit D
MIEAQLPAIVLLLTLLAAPLCSMLHNGDDAWKLAMFAVWLSVASAIGLMMQVWNGGTISYQMGGWPPPWGIEVVIDELTALVLVLITGFGALVISALRESLRTAMRSHRHSLYYACFLLCMAALIGITITGDAFNVFVFLEISSLSTYALIARGRDRRALVAAFRYLIMSTIGATFILIAIGFMYMVTGTLNMADLAQRLPQHTDNRIVQASFAFFTVGIAIKAAMFPLHYWLPGAYTYAPKATTAFLAATATKVALYVMIRFVFDVYGVEFSFNQMRLDLILIPLSIAGILYGALTAVFQSDVKKLLAWSSVSQLGYMMLGIGLLNTNGLTASITHMFNHAMIKAGLFLALAAMIYRVGTSQLRDLAGIGRTMPLTTAAFVILGAGLVGVPLTAGFISKWYLITAALDKGWLPLAVLLIISSLMALAYVAKIIDVAYFKPVPDNHQNVRDIPVSILIPVWTFALLTIYFGIDARMTADLAERVAQTLLSVAS